MTPRRNVRWVDLATPVQAYKPARRVVLPDDYFPFAVVWTIVVLALVALLLPSPY